MRFWYCFLLFFNVVSLNSQVEIYKNKVDTNYNKINPEDTVMIAPKFPNNEGDIIRYLNNEFNFRYINNLTTNNLNGINIVFSFVIDKKGEVVDFEVHNVVDNQIVFELSRVINAMPKWSPAKIGNKNIKSTMNYDINLNYNSISGTYEFVKNSIYIDNTPSHKRLKWFIVAGSIMVLIGLLVVRS